MKMTPLFSIALITMSCAVTADTLGVVLNDVINDVNVVQKNTTVCSSNPYHKSSTGTHLDATCQPVTATCPVGMTLMQPLSNCTLVASSSDATILALLKKQYSINDLNSSKPFVKKANSTSIKCQVSGINSSSDTGYTPFCFFDLSKVPHSSTGGIQFVHINSWDIYNGGADVYVNNTSIHLSSADLNNISNYKCYSAQVQATARCITLPTGFLNKLGIK